MTFLQRAQHAQMRNIAEVIIIFGPSAEGIGGVSGSLAGGLGRPDSEFGDDGFWV